MNNDSLYIREAAILLLAADSTICEDFTSAEKAVEWSRKLFDVIETDPHWENGQHYGDCTKQPLTCARCVVEDFIEKARKMEEE